MTTRSDFDAADAADSPPPPLAIIKPTTFKAPPPAREWIVPGWLPCNTVTGLYGDGGLGKSLLAQQLQTSVALPRPWVGLPVKPVSSIGFYCEDDEDELRRRQDEINASYHVANHDLAGVNWVSRVGQDNLLVVFSRAGVAELTPFCRQVREAALDLRSRLVVIDPAADVFGGNENNRSQVRQFIGRALGSIALETKGAVLLCAHPSRSGLSTGEGDGGSTDWNAAFRSRLFLREPTAENGEAVDSSERILERRKANYASRRDEVRITWRQGAFVPLGAESPGMTVAGCIPAEAVLLALLAKFEQQNRPLSSNPRSGNYAPRILGKAARSERCDYREADFAHAMDALFNSKRIRNVPYGRKGDERTKIAVADQE